MSNSEEQALEIEALESIFEDGKEFERVSDKEFRLNLLPHPTGDEENHVAVTLHITYPPEYPETAPDWELENVKGLPDEKQKELKDLIEETIASSLGMVMIYTVAEACQDFLKENNVKELSMHEEMMLREQGAAKDDGDEEGGSSEEDEDDEDDDGPNPEDEFKGLADKTLCPESNRITPEIFNNWRVKFEAEMIASGVLKRNENKAKSGKEFFLENSQAEGGDAKEESKTKDDVLVYNAGLFGELEDDDLDDLSAGED